MNEEISHPVLKLLSVPTLTFLSYTLAEWVQIAGLVLSVLSSVYCLCLIAEWAVKRLVRPIARHYGWARVTAIFRPTDRGDL